MATMDPRIDEYIAKSAEFARPILTHLRETVHAACPEVEETMKWSMPHFVYHGILCNMAAFKAHCSFGFWKGELILPKDDPKAEQAMGQFGRITALSDLPPKRTLTAYIKQAMMLNQDGVKAPSREKPKVRKEVTAPDDLLAALKRQKGALANFEGFSPSAKREYVEWLEEAKTEATRNKRLATAVEWIAEGKHRHWKYMKC
ncbi:MAG TPA: YdeI/OmpD-associated family protein [Paucimonas sp.]|nr:YdeI/OmpD-associated family protein [Paucimonas sp.]